MKKYYIVDHETHFNLRFGNPDKSNIHIAYLTHTTEEYAKGIADALNRLPCVQQIREIVRARALRARNRKK